MKRDDLPSDLRRFLASGAQLEYDEGDCEAGRVELYPLQKVPLRIFHAQTYGTPHADLDPHAGEAGTYAVRAFDLVASCSGDYEPDGLLVWLPDEGVYGTCDTSHDYVLVFEAAVTWPDIVAAPARFLNAQWDFEVLDRARATFLAPWHRHEWRR